MPSRLPESFRFMGSVPHEIAAAWQPLTPATSGMMYRHTGTMPSDMSVSITPSLWPDEISNGVFVQWCLHRATTSLNLGQWSGPGNPGGAYTFGDPTASFFTIAPIGPLSWELTTASGVDTEAVREILVEAAQRAAEHDTGQDVVYQREMTSSFALDQNTSLNFFRILGDQRYIAGPRRLSDRVILDFEDAAPQQTASKLEPPTPPLFVPDLRIRATIFVPGPAAGSLARDTASAIFETVAAICAFALGRPVDDPNLAHFPLSDLDAASHRGRQSDPSILTLARDSVSLDIFGDLAALGGPEALVRARNTFITLHESQRQRNPDISVMLDISAIEALLSPSTQHPWRKERVTRRFREGVLGLCLDAVDEILIHPNLETAFGYRKRGGRERQRREIVDHIYDLRSLPTHTGIGPSGFSFMMIGGDHGLRLALLSDLTRAALLAYLQAPRSSLVGHPSCVVGSPNAGTEE